MGLVVSFGDYGISETVEKAEDLYNLLLDLCGDRLEWDNILNKPELYTKDETYSKVEVDYLIENIDTSEHQHEISDIIGLQNELDERYTRTETDALLEDKAEKIHTHTISDILGLSDALETLYIPILEAYPSEYIDNYVFALYNAGTGRFTMVIGYGGTYRNLDTVTASQLAAGLATKQNKFTGTTAQYVRGDGSLATLDKAAVGLGNVDNTADVNKPISSATQAALNLKANDADVLKVSGNQTKTSGVLSFAVSPQVPDPGAALDAVNKQYVDNLILSSTGVFFFDVLDPSEIWLITHNLNALPVVTVLVNNIIVFSNVEYTDADNIRITHGKPYAGRVLLQI